ncbi:uncharacterized protein LOC142356739 [Convolutriloba macropyga]|uniref:uncharacterized protein LOC142356739 n=1 Tax=Convolutriloba macropyga TaxID=536237 RepID=UPI003F5208B7
MARDKLNAHMIIRWNQHTRSQGVLQPNLRIVSYAEAFEDISPQRNQRTRLNTFSRGGPPDVSCQLCSQNHNLGRCTEYLEKSVYDRQGCVRRFNLCPNCLRAHEKGLCQSKTGALWKDAMASITQRSIGQMEAMEVFRMPRVQIEMLNEICRDHSLLQNIRFPTIRDNRIGILIGADAFTATVPGQFTTGPTGIPYGVNILLGWTVTGSFLQRYTQKRVGQTNSTSITLFNHIRRRQDDPDEDLLQLFWTIEGVNFNQFSSKGQSSDDKEALSILNDTIKHIGVTDTRLNFHGRTISYSLTTTSWPKFSGPDLLCNLHGLLLRFKQYSLAITADIEAMFMQIGIQPQAQNYLRFLWTENGNERIFKYNRLIFGATCSPSCAIFVLKKCAKDNKQEHPEAHISIKQQFCMNDFKQTYVSEGEARRNAQEIKTVLHTGGFKLTKFLSNKPAALEKLLEEDKAELKAQRILGQTWDPKTDKLMFAKPKLLYTGQQMTQRKVLSMAASLFDPVGLISPFAIRIRCILHRIIKEGRNWDQLVSECFQQELQEWMDELNSMTSIQIPRSMIPNTNGTHQLHTFTDASMSAIAAIVYVRTTNADGSCTSQYVISKTKVAPIKQLSIPKLELEAATLGAELAGFCESEMTTTITPKHF